MTAIQCQTQRTVRFYGPLAKTLGRRSFSAIGLNSASEVMRCLLSNFPQLGSHMRGRHYRVVMNGRAISGDELNDPVGIGHEIHIIPAICGAGGGTPLTTILTGVALIGAGLLFPFASSFLTPLGIGLVLQGVAEMISPTPNDTPESTDPSNRSYNFSGLQQTSREGVPVPLVYGEIITGSVVLSVNIERHDEDLDDIFDGGDGSDYDLRERYPGVCWIYYSEVYLKFDNDCVGAPGAGGTDRILFGKWGDASRGDYGGWVIATAPSGGTIVIPSTCSGSLIRGYNNFTYDVLIDCAGNDQTNNPPYQNLPGINTSTGGFGTAGLYPIGYRIWQGPIPPEATVHQQNPSLYAGVPYRLITSETVAGNTLPTANLPNVYPNNPFE